VIRWYRMTRESRAKIRCVRADNAFCERSLRLSGSESQNLKNGQSLKENSVRGRLERSEASS
jgi:hypothetical protein